MMTELEAEAPGAFQILAVNDVGFEDSTDGMAELGDLPLLQDTAEIDADGNWAAEYRDVVIVDGDGLRVEAYNLTVHDLSDPANYAELKAKLLAAAGR